MRKLQTLKDYLIAQCEIHNWLPCPQENHSVKGKESKLVSSLLCQCYIALSDQKAPFVDYFPGDFSEIVPCQL